MNSENQVPKGQDPPAGGSSVPTLKSETDVNGKFYVRIELKNVVFLDNAPSTKRLKLEPIEHQSSASLLEEIARGKIELEQDKKNAEKKIVILEAEKQQLENEKNELLESLKISKAENVKKETQIVELTETLKFYRKFNNF